jgi:predicted lipid-binding transport protein (Tim44 family)
MIRFRPLITTLALVAAFAFVVVEADARPRMNSGSRGTRTYSAPPPTTTAPSTTQPINRSMTQPGTPGASAAAPRPAQQPGGMFSGRGLLGGLAAGLLGAGLMGMLMGNGFLGGLAGFASFLGLLLQVGIIAIIGFVLFRWWQRRSQPQQAYAGMPREMSDSNNTNNTARSALSGLGFGGSAGPAPVSEPLEIGKDDFDAFERLLGEVQTAYGREDLSALRSLVTPEMLSYYAEELSANTSHGVVNELRDIKLLQGDLSESWREDGKDYATVAMRYSLVDRMVDRNTGRAAEGNDAPQEATEVWTFTRSAGGTWLLSAIQQA